MKRILPLLLVSMMNFCCAACGKESKTTVKRAVGDHVETVGLSDVAKAKREEIKAENGAAALTEEHYPAILKNIQTTDQNTFPNVTTAAQLTHSDIAGNEVYILENNNASCIVLFIHGGAYAFGIDPLHIAFCDKLVERLNAKVYMPLYSLAPNGTCKESYAFMDAVYEEVLSEGKPIYIMGDSAGGGLSVGYTEYLKAKQKTMPDKVVLISPWLDVTLENPGIQAVEDLDLALSCYAPIQIGRLWAGDKDTKDPMVSPMFGELEGLPPILLFTGTHEIMYPDVTQFYQKLVKAGNDTALVYGEGLWHVFVVYDIPEAEESLDRIVKFCTAE